MQCTYLGKQEITDELLENTAMVVWLHSTISDIFNTDIMLLGKFSL